MTEQDVITVECAICTAKQSFPERSVPNPWFCEHLRPQKNCKWLVCGAGHGAWVANEIFVYECEICRRANQPKIEITEINPPKPAEIEHEFTPYEVVKLGKRLKKIRGDSE